MRYHRAEISRRIFIWISTLLYLGFMLCDIFFEKANLSTRLKFTSIVLCLVYTLIGLFEDKKNRDYQILVGAFVFTVTADVFLLLSDHYEIGVLSFCIVQSIYLLRILMIGEERKAPSVINHLSVRHLLLRQIFLRILLAIIVLVILWFTSVTVDFLLCITVFYFLSFISNLVLLGSIYIQKRPKPEVQCIEKWSNTEQPVNVRIFFLGMILFILCDISVGFYNITDYIKISESAARVIDDMVSLGMWGFYLPGQVCIALSGKK
ncbi:MAG: hypothetical protein PUC65_09025 [Clostridiales bacterium]|nr:hypothetical protein [Clostridiales bacterium]